MDRPVIIVEPLSSGVELAPTLKSRGIQAIAITLNRFKDRLAYGTQIQATDFMEIIPNQPNLVELLKKYNPLAIIPGSEEGVPLAHNLAMALTPQYANHHRPTLNRLHKAHMQRALHDAGVPSLRTIETRAEMAVEKWIDKNNLSYSPLIIKPPLSAGSDNVFHIPPGGDWRIAFRDLFMRSSNITGKANETAIVQECAVGKEFAVGTVTVDGQHHLAHLIEYNKASLHGRTTVYDYVEFVPFDEDLHGELWSYTKKVLDALGVRWGASHNEIMLTTNGPRLIESVPRMCGGPVVRFSRAATGSSQADKWIEIFADGDVQNKNYVLKKSVVPVFLRSPTQGLISNLDVLSEISRLPTFLEQFIWVKEGDPVPQTVDYLTNLGIVALAGDRNSIFADYKKIREIESKLVVKPINEEDCQ